MGAVVGGAFAAGKLDEYEEWVTSLSQRDVLRQLDPSLSTAGLFRAERVISRVVDIVGDLKIEDLPIPFSAVAVDVLAGREVWLSQGPLDRAIRASMGIPGLFTPVTINDRMLVDGGLLNPVPVAATTGSSADLVVAVSLHGPRRVTPGEAPTEASTEDASDDGSGLDWFAPLRRFIKLPGGDDDSSLGMLEVITLAMDAAQSALTRFGLAAYPPDVTVTVPADACRSLEFHRASEMIDLGHKLAVEALDDHPFE
jgi:NTE family protein